MAEAVKATRMRALIHHGAVVGLIDTQTGMVLLASQEHAIAGEIRRIQCTHLPTEQASGTAAAGVSWLNYEVLGVATDAEVRRLYKRSKQAAPCVPGHVWLKVHGD